MKISSLLTESMQSNDNIRKMEKLSIIKIGGNIIEDETSLNAFLKFFLT